MGRCKKGTTCEQRFWSKVNKDGKIVEYVGTPCWEWINAKDYGTFYDGKEVVKAHRFSYELYYGEIPGNLWVLHRCDNRSCVRPDHLFIGTVKDNVKDMEKKGRAYHPTGMENGNYTKPESRAYGQRNGAYTKPENILKGEKHGRAILTDNKIIEMRNLHDQGVSYKQLAKRFKIGKTTVSHIIKRKTWKHI